MSWDGQNAPRHWARPPTAKHSLSLIPSILRRRVWTWSALSVRVLVVLAGLAVMLIPQRPQPMAVLGIIIGVAVAASSPARGGAAFALATGIGGWLACYGVHGQPPVARVLAFAVALYLLHSATALAAAVPISSQLQAATGWRWASRWLVHLGIAGALAAASYGLSASLRGESSPVLELAGLAGGVAVLAAMTWLFSRSLR